MSYHWAHAPKITSAAHTRPHFHPSPKSRVGIYFRTFFDRRLVTSKLFVRLAVTTSSALQWVRSWYRCQKRKQAETLLLEICIVSRVVARDQVTKPDMRGIADGWRSHGGDAAENIPPHGSLVQVKQGLLRGWRVHGHAKNGVYPRTRIRLIFPPRM